MHAISNPLSLGNRGLRVVLSGCFCTSLHVGQARRIRLVFDYRITDLEAQIKTNKCIQVKFFIIYFHGYLGECEFFLMLVWHDIALSNLLMVLKSYPIQKLTRPMLRICDGSMMAAALKVLLKCFWIAPLARILKSCRGSK